MPISIPLPIPDQELVWNLLFYDNFQQSQTDSQLPTAPAPGMIITSVAGVTMQEVSVFQFGSQSSGVWVMVTCPQSDPTSFSARLALEYFPGDRFLNFVNSTFIQDLENLTVTGYFSNGLPLP